MEEIIVAMFSILGFGIGGIIDNKSHNGNLMNINRKIDYVNQYTGGKFNFQLCDEKEHSYTIQSKYKPNLKITFTTDNNGIINNVIVFE